MKTLVLLLLSAVSAMSQVVTLTSTNYGTPDAMADLNIEPYQTAELLSMTPLEGSITIFKDGRTIRFNYDAIGQPNFLRPLVVAGPAQLHLNRNPNVDQPALASFRLSPEPYPPGSALLVPPGPGGASVVLQCSTNLVDWSPATNGDYTNQPVAKFFRIRLDKIPATP